MNISSGRKLCNKSQNVSRFRALSVVRVGGGIQNFRAGALTRGLVSVEDVRRGDRQLPRRIAIHERKIDKRPAINFLLIFRYAISDSKLFGDFVFSVAEKRELKFVLVSHQIVLVHGLRRDRDQRGFERLQLLNDGVHCLKLPDAKRAPPSANKASQERTAGE